MARRLRVFEAAALKAGALPPAGTPAVPSTVGTPAAASDAPLDALEARLADLEAQLVDAAGAAERVDRARAELGELGLVLQVAARFFDDAHRSAVAGAGAGGGEEGWVGTQAASLLEAAGPDAPLLGAVSAARDGGGGAGGGGGGGAARLTCVAGTVPASRAPAFERLLFRATRGNCVYRDVAVGPVVDPGTCLPEEKAVFVVFVAGERARAKVLKAADAHGARRYPYPDAPARAAALAADVAGRLRDLDAASAAGEAQRRGLTATLVAGLPAWSARVRAEAGVYATLNRFSVDVTRQVLVGEAWVPVRSRGAAAAAARAAAAGAAAGAAPVLQPVLTYEAPPTHFAPTPVLAPFQAIVDAYATASYREVNPAVLTVVTFPFLFAVMFGDVGHALLMLAGALAMIWGEAAVARAGGTPPGGDMGAMAYSGRYCILLMAVFSIFTGLIYNEAFSIPMSLWGPGRWACPTDASLTSPSTMRADPAACPAAFAAGLAPTHGGAPYPFGVDPAWHGTRTELSFLNSVKMKMSILLGVTQMNAGIGLSYLNNRARRDRLSTLTEFWPQLIFLNALFGYLCLLILLKWASGSTADLYHTLIYMFLAPGDAGLTCGGGCVENRMFRGQGAFQALLVAAAFLAVPWMLVPKPYVLKQRADAAARAASLAPYGAPLTPTGAGSDEDEEEGERRRLVPAGGGRGGGGGGHAGGGAHGGEGGGEDFDFSEIVVHQAIHTIEFVLGAVSNTASYLRLWALSLAHSQLSAVFYDRVLLAGVRSGSTFGLFIAFFVFASATLGVLMVMETLSAFLHALRLHWVEFNSKFFAGGGHAFAPFSVE